MNITENQIQSNIQTALTRIQERNRLNVQDSENLSIDPVTLPLSTEGEVLSLSCNNADKILQGEAKLIVDYTIPLDFSGIQEREPKKYASEIIESDNLNLVLSVLKDTFDEQRISLRASRNSETTITFREYITISDPRKAPVDKENTTVVPIVTIDINKKYVLENEHKSAIQKGLQDSDIVLNNVNDNTNKKISFDDTITIFGEEFTIESNQSSQLTSAISLEKDGEIYAFTNGLTGDWKNLID